MAKTSTRPKPVTKKKTEATGSAAPDGATDIRLIPLDQLEPSPLNVRKVAASASDDAELLASMMCQEPPPVSRTLSRALAPARFIIRDLSRNRI